jgi:hypothetical protein
MRSTSIALSWIAAPMSFSPSSPNFAERDFYRRLLDLGAANDVEPLLDEAIALIVAVTGAQIAYLELYDDELGPPRFWQAHQVADAQVEAIRGLARDHRGGAQLCKIDRGEHLPALIEGFIISSVPPGGSL